MSNTPALRIATATTYYSPQRLISARKRLYFVTDDTAVDKEVSVALVNDVATMFDADPATDVEKAALQAALEAFWLLQCSYLPEIWDANVPPALVDPNVNSWALVRASAFHYWHKIANWDMTEIIRKHDVLNSKNGCRVKTHFDMDLSSCNHHLEACIWLEPCSH